MMSVSIGNKIRDLRKKKGMTQKELGAALYMNQSTISAYELGKGYVSEEIIKAMSEYYGINIALTFDSFCSEMCCYRSEEPREHREPCLNCPVQHYLEAVQ